MGVVQKPKTPPWSRHWYRNVMSGTLYAAKSERNFYVGREKMSGVFIYGATLVVSVTEAHSLTSYL